MSNVIHMRDQSHRVSDAKRVIHIGFTEEDLAKMKKRREKLERGLMARFFFGLGFGFFTFYFLTVFILSL